MINAAIIITCYNGEQYIDKCLSSIDAQTQKDFTVILVDDGSKDNSVQKIQDWQARDSRIMLLVNDRNYGVAYTRNRGIEKALSLQSVTHITFVDIDDFIDKQYLETMCSLTMKYNADIVWVNSKIVSENEESNQIREEEIYSKKLDSKEVLLDLNNRLVYSFFWAKMFKIELWKEIRIDVKYRWAEDVATMYQVIYTASSIVYTNRILYYNVLSPGSLTRGSMSEERMINEAYKCLDKIKFYSERNENELMQAANIEYYNDLCRGYMRCGTKKEFSNLKSRIYNDIKNNYAGLKDNRYATKNQKVKFFLFRYVPEIGSKMLSKRYW